MPAPVTDRSGRVALVLEPAPPSNGSGPGTARCTVDWAGPVPLLADVVPVFEQLGVRVADAVRLDEGRSRFELVLPPGAQGTGLESAFAAAWAGDTELDRLSRLVLGAGLPWRGVGVLRAACRYLAQTGLGLSAGYVLEVLAGRPDVARGLLAAFDARFHPEHADPSAEEAAAQALEALLETTTSLEQDRVLRWLRDVLAAVVRTNHFQVDATGSPAPWTTLKIASPQLTFLPLPRPAVDTFVTSPLVEGVHLRGALVARGGLRWSDRPEDFRTEALGLMKAQLVKNAVIVPAGAKGAFVLRGDLSGLDHGELQQRARAAYATFIRGLLDVTDNRVDGEVVPPPRCVTHDGPDPYLVVAADKGTATFSDLANGVALERGFWLGDAFASGGSTGYDHKAMGITARGAWVSVRRHFHELEVDLDRDGITVVGIGDMSGDVFGNGMLQSRSLRLVAAFDHRHVFLDPDPDPAASYDERARLAALPTSSWADYDRTRISAGGGVWPRTAKAVPLSPQVRERLGVEAERLSPVELIRAVLTAPVDLLWNGGVGTYVKAADEEHAEAGDRANDAVRVDAEDLRCRVVGEGGNLGLTQRARVAFARAGGSINTDFLDNSAGVDTSDREVNLKILLDRVVADGELDVDGRNALLREMTDEVAAAVLADNALQARAISVSAAHAPFLLDRHASLMAELERDAGLDRALEHLPTEAEVERLRAAEKGLTRPEVAVLLTYSKNLVRDQLLASDLLDEPALGVIAERYFPTLVRARWPERIRSHPLYREIVATQLANDVINRVGPGFLHRLEERNGTGAPDAARAFAAVHDVFDLRPLWALIDHHTDALPPDVEQLVLREAQRLLEHCSDWMLRHLSASELTHTIGTRFHAIVRELPDGLWLLMPGLLGARARELRERLLDAGTPVALAERVAALRPMHAALDLAVVADEVGAGFGDVATVHFALGERLGLARLQAAILDQPADTHWVLAAKAALRDDLAEQWAAATRSAVRSARYADEPAQVVDAWLSRQAEAVSRFELAAAEVAGPRLPEVPVLTFVLHALRRLVLVTSRWRA